MSISAAKLLVEVGADTKEAERGVGGFGDKLKDAAKSLGTTGAILSASVTVPLLGIARSALNSAMDFEQSMNVLQQVIGATGSDMASLQQQAIQLGADTVFSAGEAASAMLELGKAGMTAEQIMGSIPGVMDLAAAGGVSLAEAAALTAATLNAFHLEATESTRIADLLAATANASAADISDLGYGMQQAGFAFSMANQPVENLAASLAILTNVGLTGSDAGTALKNAFMRMMDPTQEAADLMRELGISFYDANGQMKALPDIIDNINAGMAGLTPQQRDAALATIFLSDGMKAMIPLLDAGKEGFNQMVDTVSQTGAATEVANARMKGMAGAIEGMKGSLESFLLGTALPFLDTLAPMVRAIGDLFDWFGALPQPVKNAALAFGAVLAAAGPVIAGLGALAGALAFLITPLGLVMSASALFAAAWAGNFGNIQGITQQAIDAITPMLMGLWEQIQGLLANLPSFSQVWTTVTDTLAASQPQIDGARAAFQLLWQTISGQGTGTAGFDALKGQIEEAFGPRGMAVVMGFIDTFRAKMGEFQMIWTQVVDFFAPMVARVQDSFDGFGEKMGALGPKFSALGEAALGLLPSLQTIAMFLGGVLVLAIDLFGNALAALLENLPDMIGVLLDQFTLLVTTISEVLDGLIQIVQSAIEGDWTGVWKGGEQVLMAFVDFVLGTLGNLGGMIGSIFAIISDTIGGFLADLGFDATEEIDAMQAKVTEFWNWLTGLTWETVWSDISSGFAGIVNNLLVWEWPSPTELINWAWPRASDLLDWEWPRASDLLDWDWPSLADLLNWRWPKLPTWTWPSIPTPTWLDNLLNWRPSISLPDLPGIPGFAAGTPSAPGGWAWVGERGPELVHLPRGSRVFNHRESMEMAAAGAAGGITVPIHGPIYINNDMDIEELTYEIIQRVRRGL